MRRPRITEDGTGAPAAGSPGPRATRRPAAPAPRARASGTGKTRSPRAAHAASAEVMLERALRAPSPRARALWARRGLAVRAPLDRTTQSMLLRQLYLAFYEQRRFGRAAEIADQLVELGILPDVAHQDAARARQALGDIDAAAGHLRLAARVSPPKRKAFHWWTLGSMYFLAGRYDDATAALERAARWGTLDKPLYQGHLAVARCAKGQRVPRLATLIERLSEVPAGQGYGRFVLGQLAYYDGRRDDARRYLESFLRRTLRGRAAMIIALEGEIGEAKRLLSSLRDG